MKITVKQLRHIIKEEISYVTEGDYESYGEPYDPVGRTKQANVNARIRLTKPVKYMTSLGKHAYKRAGKVYDGFVNSKTGKAWLNKGMGSIQITLPEGSWEEVLEGEPDYEKVTPEVGERDGVVDGGGYAVGERDTGF